MQLEKNINKNKVTIMKKVYLLLIATIAGMVGMAQSAPNNVDLGLFNNGTNGSNAGSGAYVEVPLRIKPGGVAYNSTISAEDFVLYLTFPKTDFNPGDILSV